MNSKSLKEVVSSIIASIRADDSFAMAAGIDDLMVGFKPKQIMLESGGENPYFAKEFLAAAANFGSTECLKALVNHDYMSRYYAHMKKKHGYAYEDLTDEVCELFSDLSGGAVSDDVLAENLFDFAKKNGSSIAIDGRILQNVFTSLPIDMAISYVKNAGDKRSKELGSSVYISLLRSCWGFLDGQNAKISSEKLSIAVNAIIDSGHKINIGINPCKMDRFIVGYRVNRARFPNVNSHRNLIMDCLIARSEESGFTLDTNSREPVSAVFNAICEHDIDFLERSAKAGTGLFHRRVTRSNSNADKMTKRNGSALLCAYFGLLEANGFSSVVKNDRFCLDKMNPEACQSADDWPRLHAAAYSGFYDAARAFLVAGDDPNAVATISSLAKKPLPYSAFELALMGNNASVITSMIDFGADTAGVTGGGKPIGTRAATPEALNLLRSEKVRTEIVDIMSEASSAPGAKNSSPSPF